MLHIAQQDASSSTLRASSSAAALAGRKSQSSLSRSRRKSLRSFFQMPLSTGSSGIVSLEGMPPPVGSLPEDIVREIADRLQPADILSFSLTSSHLRQLLLPAVYDTVVLKSSRACRTALVMLRERRHLCRYIRKLAVRPNYYLAWPRPDDYLDEEWVVEMLESLSGSLTLLTTFDWDGLELPSDRLWGAFQARCKALRSISTNVGRHPLTPTSSLFKFSNLTSFSIIARHGIPTSDANQIPEELPDEFWDMILQRCPDLEELAICTFSPTARLFNFDRIIEGSWPSLHSLTLGSFGYTSDFSLGPSALANDGAFDDFLKDHKALKYLRFLWSFRHFMSPDTLSFTLPARSLPALTTFTGIYQQLASAPSPQAIETLDLTCEPIYQSRINAVCAVLRGLPNLTSLEIWVHLFDSNRDHTTFFHNIMAACPGLTDLHFMCTNSFTAKPLKQLVSGLHLLPKLKRFSLTKGHKYLDETMVETASRILRAAPGVKQINVRWARERCPNHLKQEGTYDVVCDETTGLPASMVAVEKGIGLVGGSFSKSFRQTIDFTPSADWQASVAKRSKVVRKRVSSMLSVRSTVVYG